MLIDRELPQFDNEVALILASGAHVSKAYIASNGSLSEAFLIETPHPHLPKKQDFTARGNHQGVFAGGVSHEFPKGAILEEFLKMFKTELQNFAADKEINGVYLFSPHYMLNMIKSAIPSKLKDVPIMVFDGNYVKKHPFTLLQKIRDLDQNGNRTPIEPEAEKILQKANGAHFRFRTG